MKKFYKISHKDLENAEEKLGIDLDNDNEEGESAEHKRKMKKAGWKKFKEWLIEQNLNG